MHVTPQHSQLIRIADALTLTGDSRSAFYDKTKKGLLPKPIKIGPRAAALPASELHAINAARIRGESDSAIKALVIRLHAERALAC